LKDVYSEAVCTTRLFWITDHGDLVLQHNEVRVYCCEVDG